MKKTIIKTLQEKFSEVDVFADKSGLVIYWVLKFGHSKNDLSLREVSRQTGVSIGLVQRIFEQLTRKGFLSVTGIRTTKKFQLTNGKLLLENWLSNYDLLKKTKIWTYSCALSQNKILDILESSAFNKKIALTLHSAATRMGLNITNLKTTELYLIDPTIKDFLEKKLSLQACERGYDVLLIKPYYKSILEFQEKQTTHESMLFSPDLLTFLDLYHFPLRGTEMAEYLVRKISWLKNILKK